MKLEGNQESVLFQKTKTESCPRQLVAPGVDQLFGQKEFVGVFDKRNFE